MVTICETMIVLVLTCVEVVVPEMDEPVVLDCAKASSGSSSAAVKDGRCIAEERKPDPVMDIQNFYCY